ncbi:putative signaling protein consisting of a modified GGDEF domain and a DHH domain protein [Clostridium sp. CAG:245]|jgi:c-di-AMP phosphodiesterase-like protein|nr:DHH family phosphoesterase [Clostridia bacterium]CDA58514.1 putative signaling protein consisting of a modified GGDEF domain and a DHH domain protein [Clostridium sp. CAG:245]
MPKTKLNLDKLISRTKIYLVVIAIILVILCVVEPKAIIPSILAYIAIFVYTIWSNNKRKTEISEHINELTVSVDKAAQSTIINSPFPLVVLETNGNIIWKSSNFIKEFANIDTGTTLTDVIKELKLKIENGKNTNNISISESMKIGDKNYKVIAEYTKLREKEHKNSSEYMATVYFLDETNYVKLLEEYNNSRTCIGIIVLDNYEELMQRVTEEEKLKITSNAEKNIYSWVNKYDGLLVKSERDTYVCIFDQLNLEKIKEDKFEILDEIKEIKTQDNIQLTLSIAISENEKTNSEEYKSAKAVIDIALGRGGDQAIIKQNGKYYFFGGRTQEVEKRTRVKARIVAQALEELMNSASNVIIMGHTNSDIDAMGSGMGVYRIAKTIGKDAYIVNETNGTSLDNFINDLKDIEEYNDVIIDKAEALNKISADSLLVVVDTDKKNYVEAPELLDKTDKIVVIDHHRRGTDYIENAILTFHEVYASSACELVTELVEYAEKTVKLTKFEVEALYAGIMMDTKNFTFKTGVRTFEAAAFLRKCGVDIIKVKKWFQSDLETYNKISEIVAKSEIIDDTIAISIYDKEDSDANITCAKAADELLTISNITASFVIGKMGDKIYISGRSIGDINVQLILEKLGGGGHITVAGAQVEGMTQEEVKQELINRINEYFTEIS